MSVRTSFSYSFSPVAGQCVYICHTLSFQEHLFSSSYSLSSVKVVRLSRIYDRVFIERQ